MRQNSATLYRQFSLTHANSPTPKESSPFDLQSLKSMELKSLAQLLGTFMPVAKLPNHDRNGQTFYMIGTEVKSLKLLDSGCMVRVGGGFVTMEEYYDKYSLRQCVALFHMLSSTGLTFVDCIYRLLEEHGASAEILAKYSEAEACKWDDVNKAFIILATHVEEKLNQNRKARRLIGIKHKLMRKAKSVQICVTPRITMRDIKLKALGDDFFFKKFTSKKSS